MGLNILWVVLSLAAVLGLFFILVYATKKLNTGLGYVNGNRMKVIDRISLGRDGMLVVVSVAGRLMLIGVTGQHVEKLADLDMTPEEYLAQTAMDAGTGTERSNREQVLEEMITRDKNHPSVFCWSLLNEPDSIHEESVPYFREIFDYARELDPEKRPETFAMLANSLPESF